MVQVAKAGRRKVLALHGSRLGALMLLCLEDLQLFVAA
jgi:hypothetical protein